jgi:SAM-dependent methyltransferase
MSDSVLGFYEGLAEDYHQLFVDWRASVERQAGVLEALLRRLGAPAPRTLLDCSCGIGTQAIGLALRGYTVHATDLSPAAVARAEREARALGASLTTGVADMRTLDTQVPGRFDVVLSFDNAVPHLLTDEDLDAAARAMASRLVPGGLLAVSLRDYEALRTQRPRFDSERVIDGPEGRRILFQVWDWDADGRGYQVNQFLLRAGDGGWRVAQHSGRYRALLRAELDAALARAGFTDLRWHAPEASGFYQPIVTARRP